MQEINNQYRSDTLEEYEENIKKAEEEFDKLVDNGYASVRIVVSNHWASEGIWVEAGNAPKKLHPQDTVYKSFQKENTMGYMTDGLTFNTLRAANCARLPTFKNSKGEPAHLEPDGSDWSPAQWLQAVTGELGEYANIRKKFERGDINHDEFKKLAKAELADVATYLDILAFQLGIDLGKAVIEKFNFISDRVKSPVKIHDNGSDYYYEKQIEDGTTH